MLVTLEDGTAVQIDEQDVHILSQHGWHLHVIPDSDLRYVWRYVRVNGRSKVELLHRVILGVSDRRTFVDHKDRDGLNNLRSNLRSCSHQQNLRNQHRKPGGKTSRFKGVYWSASDGRWRARIDAGDKQKKSLGYFKNEVDAAIAYNKAAASLFGEFARLNEVAA